MFPQAQLNQAADYLLQLTNNARANPARTAAQFGIDLNEGLEPGTISAAPKPPLASNSALLNSINGHLQFWLKQFQDPDSRNPHTELGDGTQQTRASAAGYANPSGVGENVDWEYTSLPVDLLTTVAQQFQELFVDKTEPGRGHRLNILRPDYKDIGCGVAAGVVPASSPKGAGDNLLLLGQDFGIPANG